MRNFANKLIALLDERGMKQKRVAEALEVDPSQFSRWLRGEESRPSAEQLLKLARFLNVPMEFLADDAVETIPPPPSDPSINERLVDLLARYLEIRDRLDRIEAQLRDDP